MPHELCNVPQRRNKNLFAGLWLIVMGGLFLFMQNSDPALNNWRYIGPALLAVSGVFALIRARSARSVARGMFHLLLAFWLFVSFSHLWGLTFQNSWPLLLIGAGAYSLIAGLSARRK